MRYLTAAAVLAMAVLPVTAPVAQAMPHRIAACASDDGSGPRPCFWDAAHRGNHLGTSFWVDRNGHIHEVKS